MAINLYVIWFRRTPVGCCSCCFCLLFTVYCCDGEIAKVSCPIKKHRDIKQPRPPGPVSKQPSIKTSQHPHHFIQKYNQSLINFYLLRILLILMVKCFYDPLDVNNTGWMLSRRLCFSLWKFSIRSLSSCTRSPDLTMLVCCWILCFFLVKTGAFGVENNKCCWSRGWCR